MADNEPYKTESIELPAGLFIIDNGKCEPMSINIEGDDGSKVLMPMVSIKLKGHTTVAEGGGETVQSDLHLGIPLQQVLIFISSLAESADMMTAICADQLGKRKS